MAGRQRQSAGQGRRGGNAAASARAIDFGLLPELIGYNIRRAQVAVFQDFGSVTRACGLTPGQFGVLVLIDANAGLNQTALGNALGIDRSTVVAVIDKLQARNLVERAPSPEDRRSYRLGLSAEGRALLADARRLVADHESRLASRLRPGEQKQLIALLQRLSAK